MLTVRPVKTVLTKRGKQMILTPQPPRLLLEECLLQSSVEGAKQRLVIEEMDAGVWRAEVARVCRERKHWALYRVSP